MYFTGLVGVLVGTIIQMFVWQSLETLLWQPVKFGRCSQTFHGTTFTQRVKFFVLAFDNGLADRKSTFKRFNGNNQATSCQNLVNLRGNKCIFLDETAKIARLTAKTPRLLDESSPNMDMM